MGYRLSGCLNFIYYWNFSNKLCNSFFWKGPPGTNKVKIELCVWLMIMIKSRKNKASQHVRFVFFYISFERKSLLLGFGKARRPPFLVANPSKFTQFLKQIRNKRLSSAANRYILNCHPHSEKLISYPTKSTLIIYKQLGVSSMRNSNVDK